MEPSGSITERFLEYRFIDPPGGYIFFIYISPYRQYVRAIQRIRICSLHRCMPVLLPGGGEPLQTPGKCILRDGGLQYIRLMIFPALWTGAGQAGDGVQDNDLMNETVVAANDPEYYDDLSLYLNALSNPTRLKVLEALDVAEVAYQPDS